MHDIKKIERIKIDLLKLKPIEDQKSVYGSYKSFLNQYFINGKPGGQYFEKVDCPICSSNEVLCSYEIDLFKYVSCKTCGTLYNSPQLNEKLIEKMYTEGEYNNYVNNLTLKSDAIRKNITEQRKFNQVNSLFDKPGDILDVGCGAGVFLSIAVDNGWGATGVEISTAGNRAAYEKGVKIVNQSFDTVQLSEKFECICFWGVLEHVKRPIDHIAKAVSLLKESGVIVFEAPSADSVLMKYVVENNFVPYRFIESARHLTFLSRNSINNICDTFGLKIEHIETNGLDLQTILLKEYDDNTMDHLLNIQQILDSCLLSDHYRVFLRKT